MKRIIVYATFIWALFATAIYVFAEPNSAASQERNIALYSGLNIEPDAKASEARLQISRETLKRLQEAVNNKSQTETFGQRLIHSSTRTMMAGLFIFLALSFGGVWLARSTQRRSVKAGVALCALLFAAAMVHANAGPPGYIRWQNLPDNLTKGQSTRGGAEIEIVSGDDGLKLIIPLKKTSRPNGAE